MARSARPATPANTASARSRARSSSSFPGGRRFSASRVPFSFDSSAFSASTRGSVSFLSCSSRFRAASAWAFQSAGVRSASSRASCVLSCSASVRSRRRSARWSSSSSVCASANAARAPTHCGYRPASASSTFSALARDCGSSFRSRAKAASRSARTMAGTAERPEYQVQPAYPRPPSTRSPRRNQTARWFLCWICRARARSAGIRSPGRTAPTPATGKGSGPTPGQIQRRRSAGEELLLGNRWEVHALGAARLGRRPAEHRGPRAGGRRGRSAEDLRPHRRRGLGRGAGRAGAGRATEDLGPRGGGRRGAGPEPAGAPGVPPKTWVRAAGGGWASRTRQARRSHRTPACAPPRASPSRTPACDPRPPRPRRCGRRSGPGTEDLGRGRGRRALAVGLGPDRARPCAPRSRRPASRRAPPAVPPRGASPPRWAVKTRPQRVHCTGAPPVGTSRSSSA